MAYRTICDLPPELLHITLLQLRSGRDDLRSCSLACKCLRVVAVEYFFEVLRVPLSPVPSERLGHFIKFLSENERAAASVKKLTLSGTVPYNASNNSTIDDTMVASVVQRLPHLRFLVLCDFRYALPSPSPLKIPLRPSPLQSLVFVGECHPQSSLSGLFRIISLFALGFLHVPRDKTFDTSTPLNLQALHRPLVVSKLSTLGPFESTRHTFVMLEALSQAMAHDCLHDVRVQCDSAHAVAAVGRLLARAGGSITSLDVRNDAPAYLPSRADWTDPLEDNWPKLNIAACTKLESLTIYMHFRPRSGGGIRGDASAATATRWKPLSAAAAGMLSQAAQTLRFVTIELHDVPLIDPRALGLHTLDRVADPVRFPALQEVTLCVSPVPCPELGREVWLATAGAALPGLKAAGKLVVVEL